MNEIIKESFPLITIKDGIEIKFNNIKKYHVIATHDFNTNEIAAIIPKEACLSIKTTAISNLLDQEGLGGILGLGMAVMYEMSLGKKSPWGEYFSLLPDHEKNCPLFWNLDELRWLQGTDLGRSIETDKEFLVSDYHEYIMPLFEQNKHIFDIENNKDAFSLEKWIKTCTFISSRAFQIDEYHGEAIVPFADLFNHKTNGEHVHFEGEEATESDWESDDESTLNDHKVQVIENDNQEEEEDDEIPDAIPIDQPTSHRMTFSSPLLAPIPENKVLDVSEIQIDNQDDQKEENDVLEMKFIKPCPSGSEIFNTYGDHCSTTLARLYGFIDQSYPINPYSTVRLDREDLLKVMGEDWGKRDGEEVRVAFWDKICVQVADQVKEIQKEDEEELGHDHEEEVFQDKIDAEIDVEEEDEEDIEKEAEEDIEEEEDEDEDSFDDFCLESTSAPSFHLYAFLHLLSISDSHFEAVASDLDACVDFLVSLKTELDEETWIPPPPSLSETKSQNKGKGKKVFVSVPETEEGQDIILTRKVIQLIHKAVYIRKEKYPAPLSVTDPSHTSYRYMMASWIRREEEEILDGFLAKTAHLEIQQ